LDLNKIFNVRNAFILAFGATILDFISWFVIIYLDQVQFFRLLLANIYYSNLNQIGPAIWDYSVMSLRLFWGGLFSFILLFLTVCLIKKTTIIIFDIKITTFIIGILMLIFSITNIFAASGFVIGSILGICAGSFLILKKYFEIIEYKGFTAKESDFLIEVDLT